MVPDSERRTQMTDEQHDKVWAFVVGAALECSKLNYWMVQSGPQPYALNEFVAENIRHTCGALARHGFAGQAWANEAPLSASLADAIIAAAEYAGVEITPADVEAACLRWKWRNYQWEGFEALPCDWAALKAAAEERGWKWNPVMPNRPLHEVSDWAGEIAAQLPVQ
jgi:hypothetical protein